MGVALRRVLGVLAITQVFRRADSNLGSATATLHSDQIVEEPQRRAVDSEAPSGGALEITLASIAPHIGVNGTRASWSATAGSDDDAELRGGSPRRGGGGRARDPNATAAALGGPGLGSGVPLDHGCALEATPFVFHHIAKTGGGTLREARGRRPASSSPRPASARRSNRHTWSQCRWTHPTPHPHTRNKSRRDDDSRDRHGSTGGQRRSSIRARARALLPPQQRTHPRDDDDAMPRRPCAR
jgi:hypothetical protein